MAQAVEKLLSDRPSSLVEEEGRQPEARGAMGRSHPEGRRLEPKAASTVIGLCSSSDKEDSDDEVLVRGKDGQFERAFAPGAIAGGSARGGGGGGHGKDVGDSGKGGNGWGGGWGGGGGCGNDGDDGGNQEGSRAGRREMRVLEEMRVVEGKDPESRVVGEEEAQSRVVEEGEEERVEGEDAEGMVVDEKEEETRAMQEKCSVTEEGLRRVR
jgi:hypothetical protein